MKRSHRDLPHWQRQGGTAVYWITFRLEDSLPKDKLEGLNKERDHFLACHPKPWNEETRNEYKERFPARIERWLDSGYGCCVLKKPELRQFLIDAILRFEGVRHDLISAVIMPNHVHLLLRLRQGVDLGQLLKGIKGTSARWINKMRDMTGDILWMPESYDHIVRSKEELMALQTYIRKNPEHLPNGTFWLEEREITFKLVSDPSLQVLYALDN